jgi:hypothetical protein
MRTHANVRHNAVNLAISRVCNEIGLLNTVEPSDLSPDSNEKPDLEILNGSRPILVDVTVQSPTTATDITQACAEPLYVATKAEQAKHDKYRTLAQSYGATFVAFAVEAYGAFGHEAQKFVRTIADQADDNIWSRQEVIKRLTSAVAIAIQKGNARIVSRGMKLNSYHRDAGDDHLD